MLVPKPLYYSALIKKFYILFYKLTVTQVGRFPLRLLLPSKGCFTFYWKGVLEKLITKLYREKENTDFSTMN